MHRRFFPQSYGLCSTGQEVGMAIKHRAGAAGAVLPRTIPNRLGRRWFGGGIAHARTRLGEPRARRRPGRDWTPGASAVVRVGSSCSLDTRWEHRARSAAPDADAIENDPSPANSPWSFLGWLYVVLMVAGLLFGPRITLGFTF
jgi:hypothetical protein